MPEQLALSPDGGTLYATDLAENRVLVLHPEESPSGAAAGAGGTGVRDKGFERTPSPAQEALRAAGKLMVRSYMEKCATEGIKAGRQREVYDEFLEIIYRMVR